MIGSRRRNPALNRFASDAGIQDIPQENRATYKGVALKSLYFIGVAIVAALAIMITLFSLVHRSEFWTIAPTVSMGTIWGLIVGSFVVGGVMALVGVLGCSFAPKRVPIFGTIYALGQGIAIGAISGIAELWAPGVAMSALLATFVTFGVMAVLFFTGVIKVGHKFRSVMFTLLISIVMITFLFVIVALIVPSMWTAMWTNPLWLGLSIGFSVIMVIIAALFILVDLSLIKEAVDGGAEKSAEWYGAFGLTVTLLWLYVEFLRLFMKIRALVSR